MSMSHHRNGSADRGAVGNPASLVYLAIVFGAVLTVLVLVIVGASGVVSPIPDIPHTIVRVVSLVFLVSGVAVVGIISGGVRPRQGDMDELAWWRANSSRAVIAWAAAEGLAVVGGVLWLLTGDWVPLAGLGVGGLVVLVLNRPGRLMEG